MSVVRRLLLHLSKERLVLGDENRIALVSWRKESVSGFGNESTILLEESSDLSEELIKERTSLFNMDRLIESSETVLVVMQTPIFHHGVLVEVVSPQGSLISDMSGIAINLSVLQPVTRGINKLEFIKVLLLFG